MKNQTWTTYILKCANGSYYIGHTSDLQDRIEAHSKGEGASHTKKHRPITLVYQEPQESQQKAMARESQLKKWSRAKKEALIQKNQNALKELAKCRGQHGAPKKCPNKS